MAPAVAALRDVSLDDKYALETGRVFLTGTQALVRLLILQRQRDALAGLNTGGFVSGYRGSPLGALDLSLWRAKKFLDRAQITFQPGLNEDLAATAVWGSQQVNLYPGARYDGVFAMWYGKGPGVDRCGDVFKHANHAGTSKHGGVLVLAGDDHGAKSSTLPHQSDHMFSAAMMPVIYPSSVQEILDLGLHGWAMSRYSGLWVGFKCVADTVESSASVYDRSPTHEDHRSRMTSRCPPDGLSIRWPDRFLATEARMQNYKIYAALHYCRVNKLNRIVIDSPKPRLGIITSGKSYLDVRQALDDLGISDEDAAAIGIPNLQGGDAVAARAEGRAATSPKASRKCSVVEEKAAGRRVPVEGTALQLARRRPPARHRQVRRKGRMGAAARRLAASRDVRAHAGDDRPRDRAADQAPRPASPGASKS
jgi:indolepyruvate ferredoxin oxidoreductase